MGEEGHMHLLRQTAFALTCALAFIGPARAADGALDPTFGGGTGKVQLPQEGGYHGTWMPTDVAVQSDGKIIVSGWTDEGFTDCFVLRLDADGSLDTTFGSGNGLAAGYEGLGNCKYTTVAVRANDAIVAGGYGVGYNPTPGLIEQFTADGTPDQSFGSFGSVFLGPATGDTAIEVNRLVLDANGNVVGTGVYSESNGDNDFYIARIASNGSSSTYATYAFPTGASYSDVANDIAIASDGSYYLAGNGTSTIPGDGLDCAVAHYSFNGSALVPDATFSGAPDTAGIMIGSNYGGDNNDYCLALALQPPFGNLVLGGQSTAVLGITWQVANVITQPPSGLANQRVTHDFRYDQSASPVSGQVDSIERVLVEPYDNRVILSGAGPNHASTPSTGYDFGVLRLSSPSTPDTSFGTNGFALYDVGSTPTTVNNNMATSAVLWHGRLIMVGTATDPAGGTDIVIVRLAPFDGIFRNGFEPAIVIG
jgi:uncharacterized delta-60 repeat protein